MAIKLPQGFEITSSQPIDTRITLTKAQMLAIVDVKMPAVYFAICKDDGKLYLYNKTNTVDPETGKFRVHEGGSGSGNVDDVKVDGQSVVTNKVANIDLATPLALKQNKLTAGANISLDSEGNISADISASSLADKLPTAIAEAMQKEGGAEEVLDAMFNTEHFQTTIDNKIDLAIETIQAIGPTE